MRTTTTIITPVNDEGVISSHPFIVRETWFFQLVSLIFAIIRNILAIVGLLALVWWMI